MQHILYIGGKVIGVTLRLEYTLNKDHTIPERF